MNQITISDLPETIQSLLSVAESKGNSVTIIKDGIPFAIIEPIKKKKRATFGAMKHRGKIVGDLVEPTSNLLNWDVLT